MYVCALCACGDGGGSGGCFVNLSVDVCMWLDRWLLCLCVECCVCIYMCVLCALCVVLCALCVCFVCVCVCIYLCVCDLCVCV